MFQFVEKRLFVIFFALAVYGIALKLLPAESWLTELMQLGLSVLLPAQIFLGVYYGIKKRIYILLFLPLFLLNFSAYSEWFAITATPKYPSNNKLKIASLNAATLDVKRFAPSINHADSVSYKKLFDWLRKNKDIDVLCMQEFYDSFKPGMERIMDSVVAIGGYKYYCINPSFSEKHKGFFGVIIFSKKEPINCEKLIYGEDDIMNKGIYLDFLDERGDTLRILNLHLASMSIRFDNKKGRSVFVLPYKWAKRTYKRLKNGFDLRLHEIDSVQQFASKSPYNMIVCGDFNSTPHMHANRVMRQTFKDAFLQSGFGWGFSYHHFPYIIRIDQQYYRGSVNAVKTYIDRSAKFSDHYPIITEYSITSPIKEIPLEEFGSPL